MKKIFLFAAAAVAALTVNAKVISFANIVDNSSADAAKSAFEAAYEFSNISIAGKANSAGDAYYVEVTQETATTDWETTSLRLNNEDQVFFAIKDGNNKKLVIKAYKEYIQPNGKAVCLVISDLNPGDKVKITLKAALNKEAKIEGATVETCNFASAEQELEVAAGSDEIRVYSQSLSTDADGKTSDAKWQLISVEVPGGSQAIENTNASVKAEKFFENGQLIIRKNGVKFNALGAKL